MSGMQSSWWWRIVPGEYTLEVGRGLESDPRDKWIVFEVHGLCDGGAWHPCAVDN